MKLQHNPFYILRLPCNAGRRDVMSAAEERSFTLDAEVCSNAQNELLHPSKRLSAELGWFLDLNANEVDAVCTSISNNGSIYANGLTSLSQLNATLYNFSLTHDNDQSVLRRVILAIDRQFTAINAGEITGLVNKNRTLAKLAPVQEQQVSEEIGNIRYAVRQAITERLAHIEKSAYVGLVTMLAEKFVAGDDYGDGTILSDIIDQYEITMQSLIEIRTKEIQESIQRIQQMDFAVSIESNIKILIWKVRQWDRLVQPIQLKSQASGMPHDISEQMGHQLRSLALFMHNEKEMTQEAQKFVNDMKGVFLELADIADMFNNDAKILEEMLQKEDAVKQAMSEIDALNQYLQNVTANPTSVDVDNIVRRMNDLNTKLKQSDMDADDKIKFREILCGITRNAAVELHNTKHQTAYAISITRALMTAFRDMPALETKLTNDWIMLSKQTLPQNQGAKSTSNTAKRASNAKKNPKGCIWFCVAVFVVVLFIYIESTNRANTYKPSDTVTRKPSVTATRKPPATYTLTPFATATRGQAAAYAIKPSTTRPVSNATQAPKEVMYLDGLASGKKVYADIVSIFPEYGIYTQGAENYSHFVCRCKTTSGSTVWTYMTVSVYKSNFDFSALSSVSISLANEVTFASPKRIHGTTQRSESVISGLSANIGTMVIIFASLD